MIEDDSYAVFTALDKITRGLSIAPLCIKVLEVVMSILIIRKSWGNLESISFPGPTGELTLKKKKIQKSLTRDIQHPKSTLPGAETDKNISKAILNNDWRLS